MNDAPSVVPDIIEQHFLPAARTVALAGWAAESTVAHLADVDTPAANAFRRLMLATIEFRDAYAAANGVAFKDPHFKEPK